MACSCVMPWMDVLERISFKYPDYLATFGKLETSVIGAGRKCTPRLYLRYLTLESTYSR